MFVKNLVLGGGIVGLIAGAILNDSKVVDKHLGGQMGSGFGPRFLYDTINTRNLLTLLNLEIREKNIFASYLYSNGEVTEFRNYATEEERIKYWNKTRHGSKFKQSAMSSGILEYKVLDLDFKLLVEKLVRKINIENKHNQVYNSFAQKINIIDKLVTLSNSQVIEYENLITTLPAPLFYMLCGSEFFSRTFKSYNKVFVKSNSSKYNSLKSNMFDYIYHPGDVLYHRTTKLGDFVIFEFSNVDKDVALNSIQDGELLVDLKFGQVGDGSILDLSNLSVFQIGRYAEWNHSIKTENVLDNMLVLGAKLNVI